MRRIVHRVSPDVSTGSADTPIPNARYWHAPTQRNLATSVQLRANHLDGARADFLSRSLVLTGSQVVTARSFAPAIR